MTEQVFRVADTHTNLAHDEVTLAIAEALRRLMTRTEHADLTSWLKSAPTEKWLSLTLSHDGKTIGIETVFAEDK